MRSSILFVIILLSLNLLSGQYIDGSQVKYGNEWIDYSKSYIKIEVEEDGIYRISRQQLLDAGFDVNSIPMSDFALFHIGEQVPLTVSTNNLMGSQDYFEFYGKKNRSEIDKYYFSNEADQLNPEFSLITDVSSYFLVQNSGANERNSIYNSDISGNLPPVEPYYMHEVENVFAVSNGFNKPIYDELRNSEGQYSEGFALPLSKKEIVNVSLDNYVSDGQDAFVDLRFGTNKPQHDIKLLLNNTQIKNYTFIDYNLVSDKVTVESSLLKNNMNFDLRGTYANSDRFYLSELSFTYPRSFEFSDISSVKFSNEASLFDRYFELMNFSFDNELLIYDIQNQIKINGVSDNGVYKFLSPANSSGSTYVISSDTELKTPKSITEINFTDFTNLNSEYLILSHNSLFDDGNGTNLVQEYANYRESSAGGGYSTQVVDAQDLYDQFGYGVEGHFLAIKSFLNYCEENWNNLEMVFIIGKGREYYSYRFDNQKEADPYFHVPTFGFPGSDNLLISNWDETTPKVPIGRIACRNTDELRAYFVKVVEHELQLKNPQTIEGKLWMKKVLHLSGGDSKIQEIIKSYLRGMENEIEQSKMGAEVTTFYKSTSDPIENVQSQELIKLIDNGLSLITFFGHSAIGVFDLNLEKVDAYNNKGKYPVMMSLGCHSGNIHTQATGLSQQFVLADNKGAIAFMAASSQAYIQNQEDLGSLFYKNYGEDYYGRTLGVMIREAMATRESIASEKTVTLLQQFTLHGDPAIKMHPAPSEDYIPEYASINISPDVINAYQDSFHLCFNVVNIGTSNPQAFKIRVEHTGPSGQVNADTIISGMTPVFREEFCLDIPLKFNDLYGKNLIRITVDSDEVIVEMPEPEAENNNTLDNGLGGDFYEFYILNNGAVPVAPKNYSIYANDDVVLKASSFNALGDKENYILQIDTTENFNSPSLLSQTVSNIAGLISWEPSIDFKPGTVYYWRISPEQNASGVGFIWETSSFLYLPSSSPGWNQSHVYQFDDNTFDELQLENRKLEYVADYRDIRVVNRVSNGENFANFFINGIFIGFSYYINKGPLLGCTVFDSLGNLRWNSAAGSYGAYNPESYDIWTHYYRPTEQQSRVDLVNFLDTVLEKGDHVYFYSVHPKNNYNANFATEEWAADSIINNGKNIFNVLTAQGSKFINDFRSESMVPFNFFYRKDVGALQEGRADDIYGTTDNTAALFGRWYKGTETSVTIGPSTKWRKLVWRDDPNTITPNDSSYLRVYGVDNDGEESLLINNIVEKEINLAQIDPVEYPFLKLQYYTYDQIDKSSPNLQFWRVFFDGDAELALNSLDNDALFHADTLEQGDDFQIRIPLENIGMVDVDSVDVLITVTDEFNKAIVEQITLAPIKVNGKSYIDYSLNTDQFYGVYTVSVEANFSKNPSECFYFNNFGLRSFYVRGDLRNPLLDVSFDGRRIMDGDLVSSEPIIRIVTQDENMHLLMNDTSTYKISIVNPEGVTTEISMDDPAITFIPSTSLEENKNEVIYTPTLETDGEYTLIVKSEDMTGNLSGNQDFKINFRVINEELISNVLNYPNPFSDCTQFVFTLTGNELPQDISIKIMTVSGKVVKEINGLELGPLHIGVNRTEYKWDGTDEFGSKLANGVYLYQVVSRKQDGEIYDSYDVGTNKYFHRNIGKLVILR